MSLVILLRGYPMYAQIVSWQLNLLLNRTIVIMRHKFLFLLIVDHIYFVQIDFFII